MTLNDTWKNENHSADCYQVIPIPNRAYFESRTICVCELATNKNLDNRSQDHQGETTK
jgi:hypothetical protein